MPRVDDVLDDQNVPSGDALRQVLEYPDHSGALGTVAVARDFHEVDLDGQLDGPYEIGQEDNPALQDVDKYRRLVGVVLGNALPEFRDPVLYLLLR